MNDLPRVGIIGEGSWATAIIKILLNNVPSLNWYIRESDTVEYMKQHRHNPNYLSSVELEIEKLNLYTNVDEVVNQSDWVIFVVPSAFLKPTIENAKLEKLHEKFVITAIKGIVPDDNMTVSDYLHQKYYVPLDSLGVISGPCHAEEVALERLSYLTLVTRNAAKADTFSSLLNCRYIHTSRSNDVFGVEYSAVLKNIFAVAAGMYHGLRYGDNFQSVLISNAIQEIERFVNAVAPVARDIKHSVYLGDLLVTAYSQFSRNRTFGNMIGKGYSVKSAQLEMNMIAEGYFAVKSIYEINKKYQVFMPITNAVYHVLYERISPIMEMGLLSDKLR